VTRPFASSPPAHGREWLMPMSRARRQHIHQCGGRCPRRIGRRGVVLVGRLGTGLAARRAASALAPVNGSRAELGGSRRATCRGEARRFARRPAQMSP